MESISSIGNFSILRRIPSGPREDSASSMPLWTAVFAICPGICKRLMLGSSSILSDPRDDSASSVSYGKRGFYPYMGSCNLRFSRSPQTDEGLSLNKNRGLIHFGSRLRSEIIGKQSIGSLFVVVVSGDE